MDIGDYMMAPTKLLAQFPYPLTAARTLSDPGWPPLELNAAVQGLSCGPLVWVPAGFWWGRFYGPLFSDVAAI